MTQCKWEKKTNKLIDQKVYTDLGALDSWLTEPQGKSLIADEGSKSFGF